MKKHPANDKIRGLKEIVMIAGRARAQGKKIVTTNGCFDILHVGHMSYLKFARSLGDILIVGVNSDNSVKRNKGPLRPIVPERERAEMLASLGAVDHVFIFGDQTPDKWLMKIRPHIHVKGSDWTLKTMPERETVEKIGGKIVLAPLVKGKSTTNTINKVLRGGSQQK